MCNYECDINTVKSVRAKYGAVKRSHHDVYDTDLDSLLQSVIFARSCLLVLHTEWCAWWQINQIRLNLMLLNWNIFKHIYMSWNVPLFLVSCGTVLHASEWENCSVSAYSFNNRCAQATTQCANSGECVCSYDTSVKHAGVHLSVNLMFQCLIIPSVCDSTGNRITSKSVRRSQ